MNGISRDRREPKKKWPDLGGKGPAGTEREGGSAQSQLSFHRHAWTDASRCGQLGSEAIMVWVLKLVRTLKRISPWGRRVVFEGC